MPDIRDKVVVVAGGLGLIGKSLCARLVAEGAKVAIADVDAERYRDFAGSDVRLAEGTLFAKTDITRREDLLGLIATVVERFGRIDALVNCAYPRNSNFGRAFEEVEYSDLCENLNLHVGGFFLSCQTFIDHFKRSGGGNILNFSSIYGVIPPKFEIYSGTPMKNGPEYAAIKAAIIHLTKYMAKYCFGSGIRVNCLSPGGIYDHQNPVFLENYRKNCASQGMLDKSDLNGMIIFLISDESRVITGQNFVIDDGFCL